jgi:hypothetical protein
MRSSVAAARVTVMLLVVNKNRAVITTNRIIITDKLSTRGPKGNKEWVEKAAIGSRDDVCPEN